MTDLACAIDLLEDRASLYRLLASLYYQPLSEEQIDALAASDLAGLAGDSESPFAPAYRDLHGALRLRHTGTKEELAADFTGAFYGIRTREGRTAQPFESLFRTQGPGQLMGEARSEVYRELRAHQLRVPEGVDLPEDHLSFIFAYLGRLCDDAAAALRAGNEGQAAELLEAPAILLPGPCGLVGTGFSGPGAADGGNPILPGRPRADGSLRRRRGTLLRRGGISGRIDTGAPNRGARRVLLGRA